MKDCQKQSRFEAVGHGVGKPLTFAQYDAGTVHFLQRLVAGQKQARHEYKKRYRLPCLGRGGSQCFP